MGICHNTVPESQLLGGEPLKSPQPAPKSWTDATRSHPAPKERLSSNEIPSSARCMKQHAARRGQQTSTDASATTSKVMGSPVPGSGTSSCVGKDDLPSLKERQKFLTASKRRLN